MCVLIIIDDIPDEPILDFDELSDAIDAATPKSKQPSVKKSRNGIPFPMPSVKVCDLLFNSILFNSFYFFSLKVIFHCIVSILYIYHNNLLIVFKWRIGTYLPSSTKTLSHLSQPCFCPTNRVLY